MDSHTPGYPLTGAGRNRTDPRRAKLGGAAEALPVLPLQLSVPWAAKGRASFLSASAVIFHFKAEGKESMSQSWLLSLPPALLPLTPNPQCTLHLPRATPPSPSPSQPPLLWLKGASAGFLGSYLLEGNMGKHWELADRRAAETLGWQGSGSPAQRPQAQESRGILIHSTPFVTLTGAAQI